MYSTKSAIHTILFWGMLCEVRGTCFDGEYSIKNMMLRQHIFKEMKTSNSLECLMLCKEDVRCQSFNYVINQDICELNNRTKEAAPENFVQNFKRYYAGLVTNRGESDKVTTYYKMKSRRSSSYNRESRKREFVPRDLVLLFTTSTQNK